jgi:predicted double-glycine peptidase
MTKNRAERRCYRQIATECCISQNFEQYRQMLLLDIVAVTYSYTTTITTADTATAMNVTLQSPAINNNRVDI